MDCAGVTNGTAVEDVCGDCNGSITNANECSEEPPAGSSYIVDLEETGVSQLTILLNSISSLEIGDEVGIFDANAITNYNDCSNQTGELLVGAGVWDGSQLNLTSIGTVDMCAFGSVQLAGFVDGNPVIIKVYRPSLEIEFETEITWENGTGVFGDIIQSISEITLIDGNNVTEINSGCDLPDLNIYFSDNSEIFYNSSVYISGFQFTINGVTINSASGGDAATAGFMVSASGTTVLSFSLSASPIPPGCGTLIALELEGDVGIIDFTISDPSGVAIEFNYYEE